MDATAAHKRVKRCDSSQGDTNMKQIQNATLKHGPITAALVVVLLALATFANAETAPSGHSHKTKKGSLTITTPTDVGGATLQPGDYEVKEVDSPSGPALEFTLFVNEYAEEGWSSGTKLVVARVKVTEQALSLLPKHTQLQLAPHTTDAVALQIRGNAVAYQFAPSQTADQPDAMASPMDAGQHQ
jgi:hypothetical protein